MTAFVLAVVIRLALIVLPGTDAADPAATNHFSPKDNILIDCGASTPVTLPSGRIFQTDPEAEHYLDAKDNIQISVPKADADGPSPIYLTARVFQSEATYLFHLEVEGWHWVRLHLYPIKNAKFDLREATFSVTTDYVVLLHRFSVDNNTGAIEKEYLLNVTDPHQLRLKFSPVKNSFAFINAIEVMSALEYTISDSGTSISPVSDVTGLDNYNYQVMYHVNMGGPILTSANDTLARTWVTDDLYIKRKNLAKTVTVPPKVIKFPEDFPAFIAPATVYASAVVMADAYVKDPHFNVTWEFNVDPKFGYVIRLHFCDIVSKTLNDLYFNVYINEKMAISGLDLSSLTNGLAVPYYKDMVVNSSLVSDGLLIIQISPMHQDNAGTLNAILNALEIMKLSNSANSLDGEFGVEVQKERSFNRYTVAAVGFAMMFGAFMGLGAMVIKWHRRPQDWQERNSISAWLLPLRVGDSNFIASKNSSDFHKSNFHSTNLGLGRYFSFAEIQKATKDFDPNMIIGVGGFGNVYLGELDDGQKVAIKRGNPQSEQGITEFQTEIQMLSKLRHRHLVSLIGCCDENSEMILVYEYMSNGPLRDHLYGKNLPALSWKQRLEICIGAARGLHYLHTGTAQMIIHRDVKTTNILLDENFVAKVSDFGLSKDAPAGQGHVSTAVKGSFGYLDPEYFKRQQLTDKSDVYSFGVVLFESLCGRPALDPALPREQVNLADWALEWKRTGLLEKIMDPNLMGTVNPESLKKFGEAAEQCLSDNGMERPTMGDVLWNLEYALQLQEAFCQGKTEEDNKFSPIVVVSPTSPTGSQADNCSGSISEDSGEPGQIRASTDHSSTDVFQQFHQLNGR